MGKSKGIDIGYNPLSGEFEDMTKQYEDDAYQYEEWKKSSEYIDMVNSEFAKHKPKYSEVDIDNAKFQMDLNHFKLPQRRLVLMYTKNYLDNTLTKH